MDKTKNIMENLKEKLENLLKKSNECCIMIVIFLEVLFVIF